jgi:hypothetical protein
LKENTINSRDPQSDDNQHEHHSDDWNSVAWTVNDAATDHSGPTGSTAPDADGDWWPRLVDRINEWWMYRRPAGPAMRDMLRIPPRHANALILATITALAATAAAALWWLVAFIVTVVVNIGDSGRDAAHTAAGHLSGWAITRTITNPVHDYLNAQAVGLPVPTQLAWWTWLATTGGLFLTAVLGSRGARIGWTLAGALTVAMVYTATPHPGHTVAAGLAVTAWSVLSIAAFNRWATRPRYHLALNLPPRRPVPPRPGPTGDATTT